MFLQAILLLGALTPDTVNAEGEVVHELKSVIESCTYLVIYDQVYAYWKQLG